MGWTGRTWAMVALVAVSSHALDSLLVWSDEFDRTGLPDSTKWGYDTGGSGGGNNEAEYYTDARLKNAHCDGSHLVISAIREDPFAWAGAFVESSGGMASPLRGPAK